MACRIPRYRGPHTLVNYTTKYSCVSEVMVMVWEPNTTRKGLLSFSAISYLYHEFLYSGVGPP